MVGAIAMSYSLKSEFLEWTLIVAIPTLLIQFGFSVWAVSNKWEDHLAYGLEASREHSDLSFEFKSLANIPLDGLANLKSKFEILSAKLRSRVEQDKKFELSERESRRGMRFALRQYKWECSGCQKVPISMKSTNCSICGKLNLFN